VWRYDAQRPQLGASVEAARLLSSAPEPIQVRHDVMNTHNWAARIGQWLGDCPVLRRHEEALRHTGMEPKPVRAPVHPMADMLGR
jgi:hypothetical protein